jgi:hypothetical protein
MNREYANMQRTTITIDQDLLSKVKALGKEKGLSVSRTISELVRIALLQKQNPQKHRFMWKTYKGQLRPGINIDDRDQLYNLMENHNVYG